MKGEDKKILLTMFFVVLLALILRFWSIKSAGLVQWDEGYYVRTASWLIGNEGAAYPWEPPVFSMLVATSFLIFGVKDYVAIGTSAFFGVLTIIVTYFIGKKLFNKKVGLIAASFLAVNEYHIMHSRMALIDTTFTFFFSLALLFFIYAFKNKQMKHYLIFGLFSAITLNTKYNGFQVWIDAFLFILTLIAFAYFKKEFKRKKKEFVFHIKGLMIAALIMILLHIPWIFMLGIGNANTSIDELISFKSINANTFSEGIKTYANIFLYNKGPAFREALSFTSAEKYFSYAIYLIKWTSPLILILLLAGIFNAFNLKELRLKKILKIKEENLFLVVWFIFIFAFFSILAPERPRTIIIVLPALALIAADGLSKIKNKNVMNGLWLLILATSIFTSWNSVTTNHDGFRMAGAYLEENASDGLIFSTAGPQLRFYFEEGRWWMLSSPEPAEKIKWVVLDFHKNNGWIEKYVIADVNKFENEVEPIVIYKNEYLWLENEDDFLSVKDHNLIKIYKITSDIQEKYFVKDAKIEEIEELREVF